MRRACSRRSDRFGQRKADSSSGTTFPPAVKGGNGTPIRLGIERGTGSIGGLREITITPKREDEASVYGNKVPTWIIGVVPRGDEEIKRYGPIEAAERGVTQTVEIAGTLMVGLWQIVDGSIPVRQALGGPIMIAQMAGKETHEGLSAVLMFTVMISLRLGILNLLPVPLLDGGHLLFFAFEGLRGRPLHASDARAGAASGTASDCRADGVRHFQ